MACVPWQAWAVCCNLSLILSQGDLKLGGTLYLVLYARASKRRHTGGKCVTYCGLPLQTHNMERATVQSPNMEKATQITEHAYKTGRQAPMHIKLSHSKWHVMMTTLIFTILKTNTQHQKQIDNPI